ncbi:MAG: hypothetical protein ACI8O8_001132 [Oleiphilaceae bacterium]|jgi:hypothetical protein
MATKTAIKPATKTRAASKKKQPAASETSNSIDAQVKEFLASGGAIEQIKTGVTGQQNMPGPRHINISNKPK